MEWALLTYLSFLTFVATAIHISSVMITNGVGLCILIGNITGKDAFYLVLSPS